MSEDLKLYDFDGMFDERLTRYIKEHGDTYGEDELEDAIPELYRRFGDTEIKQLGMSPNAYYRSMDDDTLMRTLRAHISEGVPVSEFLRGAVESREGHEKLLMPLLDGSEEEITFAVNMLGPYEGAMHEYMRVMLTCGSEDLRNLCADFIKEDADAVKEEALRLYGEGKERILMLEILSRVRERDDRVYDVLVREFRTDPENVPMLAGFLAEYGDDRALPFLLERIDEEGINYVEYQELKYAVETLGGTYETERDFSSDVYYQIVKEHSQNEQDIFSAFEDDDGDGQ